MTKDTFIRTFKHPLALIFIVALTAAIFAIIEGAVGRSQSNTQTAANKGLSVEPEANISSNSQSPVNNYGTAPSSAHASISPSANNTQSSPPASLPPANRGSNLGQVPATIPSPLPTPPPMRVYCPDYPTGYQPNYINQCGCKPLLPNQPLLACIGPEQPLPL